MKYFWQIENKYIDRPFVINTEKINKAHDVSFYKNVPVEFYMKHLSLLEKIEKINNHLVMTILRDKVQELCMLYDPKHETDEMIEEFYTSGSYLDELYTQIRDLARSLPYLKVIELMQELESIDLSNSDNTRRIEKAREEMRRLVESEEELERLPLRGLSYIKDEELIGSFYNFETKDSEYLIVLNLWKKAMENKEAMIHKDSMPHKDTLTYKEAKRILSFYMDLIMIANLTNDNILEEIKDALEDLEKLEVKIHIPKNEDKPDYESIPLPDSWFILPGIKGFKDMLFNTTGDYGHKDANLKNLLWGLFCGRIVTQKSVNYWLRETKKFSKAEFADSHEYNQTIKLGRQHFLMFKVYDKNGEPYGVRPVALNIQKEKRKYSLQNWSAIIPEGKKREYARFFKENSKYFNILNQNGAPFGYLECIDKAIELAGDDFGDTSKIITNKRIVSILLEELKYHFGEITGDEKICSLDMEKEQHIRSYIFSSAAKNLIVSNNYAHALVIRFFAELHEYAKDYRKCIHQIREMDIDQLLIRACGFNKVTRNRFDGEKTILTSNPNYQEEFKEYVEHGWSIEYSPPIVIDKEKGELIGIEYNSGQMGRVISKREQGYRNDAEEYKDISRASTHRKILVFSDLSARYKAKQREKENE